MVLEESHNETPKDELGYFLMAPSQGCLIPRNILAESDNQAGV